MAAFSALYFNKQMKRGQEEVVPQLHPQPQLSYMPSKYSKALNMYSRSQMKTIVPFIASISRTCSYSSLYPICKLVKAICKIFMLSQIEIIFFAYLIRETEWDIRDKTIYHNAENIQDIIYCSIDNLDYKRIILYLMVTAFTVKFYLNEKNTGEILEEVNKRCQNFKQIFQSWNKKHSAVITKINPRTLNSVYKNLYASQKQEQPDFNMLVDSIIQISPAYNPEPKPTPDKKKASGPTFQKKKQQQKAQKTNSLIMSIPAMFSSSGILKMAVLHPFKGIQQVNTINNHTLSGGNLFNPCRSQQIRQDYLGIMGSSVVGGLANIGMVDMKEEDDCGELVVGLQDGQSEENIIFEDKNNNPNGGFQVYNGGSQFNPAPEQGQYYTSVISLNRRLSGVKEKEKDNLGSSQVSVGAGVRREASVVNLQAAPKQKDESQV